MTEIALAGNPFALMLAPEAVFAAIERSDRLARLKRTVCHPLDKPRPQPQAQELSDFDLQIDAVQVDPTGFGEP